MKALVTGAGGFLGGAIARALWRRGDTVHTLQRGRYERLQQPGMINFQGDIAIAERVSQAAEGCDIIFHVAARAGVWGDYQDYYRSNVQGTENVLRACRQQQIGRLIYTSSPSVVFDGTDDEGVDESAPYSHHMMTHYQRTKAEAERLVLAANSTALATVALRPHLLWGPGDTQLLPRIIKRARTGRLRLVNAPGKLMDAVYIDNAVDAHVLAAEALACGAACAGKTYFIGNGEPVAMASLINAMLQAAGLDPVTKTINPRLLYGIGAVTEGFYALFRIQQEPFMTRFIARQLACSHWYDLGAAARDLGYTPRVSMARGMAALAAALADPQRESA